MPEADPDLSLVLALQAGDDQALDALMSRYKRPLFALIYRSVGDEALAEELLQDTFVRCYFSIGKFVPRAKFATWLHTIAINLCRDHARSRRKRESMLTESFGEMSELERQTDKQKRQNIPDKEMENHEALSALQDAITRLPHDLKTAFIMCILEGRSQTECAEILGVSPKAVETRVYRARKILQEKMAVFLTE